MKVLMRRLFLTAIISLSASQLLHAQMLALKTNAAAYAAFAPNLTAELVTSNKTSVSLEGLVAIHSLGKDLRAFAARPEFRYWFHGRPMSREFIGVSIVGATYVWEDGDKKYKGNVGGFGITFGYVWELGHRRRWNMELHGGLGMYRYSQQPRYGRDWNRNEWTDLTYNERGWSILPYKVGLSFSYILPTEKIWKNF